MTALNLTSSRALVIAPHADDEVLGCGGTIARLVSQGARVTVAVLFGRYPKDKPEVWRRRTHEALSACSRLGHHLVWVDEQTSVLDPIRCAAELNDITRRIVLEQRPDTIFAPWAYDPHPDHRRAFQSFAVHWRPYTALGQAARSVYLYETISETHLTSPIEPAFAPDTWIEIGGAELKAKLEAFERYESQVQRHPSARSVEALKALAVWRGSQVGVPAAEAFVTMRRVLRRSEAPAE